MSDTYTYIEKKGWPGTKEAQWGVPAWLLERLGLPETTERVVLIASNTNWMKVSAKFYPLHPKKRGRK